MSGEGCGLGEAKAWERQMATACFTIKPWGSEDTNLLNDAKRFF